MKKTISKRELAENVKQAKSYLKYGNTARDTSIIAIGFVLGLVVAMIIITPFIISLV